MLLHTLSLLSVLSLTLGLGAAPWSTTGSPRREHDTPPRERSGADDGADRDRARAREYLFDDELVVGQAVAQRPTRWLAKLERCSTRGRRRFCDGPRMVPVASAADAARAQRLGLGTRVTANRLLVGALEPAWIEAAGATQDTLGWPVDEAQVSRGYGFIRRAELRHRRHDGMDFAAPTGAGVRAANDGIVAYADNGVSGFGNLVIVVHGDGTSTHYAHLLEAHVTAGQRVARGQQLGLVGNTGLSRGPHLHFEWRRRGRPLDPARALSRGRR